MTRLIVKSSKVTNFDDQTDSLTNLRVHECRENPEEKVRYLERYIYIYAEL